MKVSLMNWILSHICYFLGGLTIGSALSFLIWHRPSKSSNNAAFWQNLAEFGPYVAAKLLTKSIGARHAAIKRLRNKRLVDDREIGDSKQRPLEK